MPARQREYGIKVIYGMEAYLVDGQKERPYHVILLARNLEGLKTSTV